ncbi:MAG: protease 4 [Candidatus Methanofastidiosum methylothiophilum]|uniref:Protease 4 n=1 Tax=Candidatus Methanofastidiosum methylothiophilum TaxID=1705564 RepID=A0A150IJX0_9EURY|nr:MAG: protease 4 [Candidatus Methanofastidiosum methylthiophilus]KYC47342.1 MAG: protease 4 [Candidatus Methanofastidiosum methylthiophilus]KYC49793.1 MAG: protease 4 [Candidatus Methanofastidiosum methylthiophilus]
MKFNKKFIFLIFAIFVLITASIGCNFNLEDIGISSQKGGVTTSGEVDILRSKLSAYESQESLENLELQKLREEIERIKNQNIPVNGNIAVIRIFGILDQEDVLPIASQLRRLTEDREVGGVVLWIDSPGGGVSAVTEIYDEVNRLSLRKPVVAYVGGVAASGGYYLAVASDKIVVKPDAILGSIGVIYVHEDLTEYFKMFGIKIEVIKTGEDKDLGAPWRPLSNDDRENIKNMINEDFDRFVYVVSKGRNLPIEDILKYSDGNVWSGTQAVSYKLADRVGTLDTAIEELKVSAGLKNPKVSFFQIADDGSVSNMSYEYMRYQYAPSIRIQKK